MAVPDVPSSQVSTQALPSNPMMDRPIVAETVTSQLASVMNDFRKMADNARVAEATNALEQKRMELTSDFSQQLGANVLPKDGATFTARYVGRLKEKASDLAVGLSPRQQAMFNAQATQLGMQFQNSVQQHETQQLFNHAVKQHNNTITMAIQSAPDSYRDPGTLGNLQGRIDGAVASLAQMQGLDADGAKLLALEAHDKFNTAVVAKFMDPSVRDYAGARDYLTKHMGEMSSSTVSKLDDLLLKRENVAKVTSAAAEVWNDKSLNYEQKTDKLLNMFQNDPESQGAAIEQLKLHLGAYKQVQDQAYGNVWDMITGLNPNTEKLNLKQIESTPEWLALDGDQRKSFVSNYRLWLRQLTETTTPQEDYERCVAFNDYVTHPMKLLAMDNAAMKKVAPTLGKQYFDQLMDLRSKLINGQAELANVTLDANQVNIAAINLGFKPGKKMSLEQAKDLASFKSQAITELQALQMRLGRKASDSEQKQVLDRLSADVVVKRKGVPWSYTPEGWQYISMPTYKAIDTLPYQKGQINEARQWLLVNGLEVTPANVAKTIEQVFKDPGYKKGQ